MQPRSTRLNQYNRDKFINKVMENKLPPNDRPTLKDFTEEWGPEIFKIVYTKDIRKKIADLPNWITTRHDSIKVGMPHKGKIVQLAFTLPHAELLPKGASSGGYYNSNIVVAPIPEGHPIIKAYAQNRQNEEDYAEKKRQLQSKVHALVASCNTSGQLYAAWPEAIQYSDCFPYKQPNKHSGAKVSATEMDLSVLMTKAHVTLPDDEA